jgi:hypothetical protein
VLLEADRQSTRTASADAGHMHMWVVGQPGVNLIHMVVDMHVKGYMD